MRESLIPVVRFFEEVVNKHDASLLSTIVAPQMNDHDVTGGLASALVHHPFSSSSKIITTVFPDLHDRIEAIVVTDTRVAVRIYGTGTHSADLFGVPATNKPLAWTATMVWQIYQGRIHARWMAFDYVSQMIQLGVAPSLTQVTIPFNQPLMQPTDLRDSGEGGPIKRRPSDVLPPVLRLIEALRTGNILGLEEIIASDFIDHGGWIDGLPTGPRGLYQEILLLHQAFPDLAITVEHLFGDGEQVAVCITGRGTHRGELFGIAPTYKRVIWMTVGIYRLEEGKIKERWIDGTRFELLRQFGILQTIPFEWLTKIEGNG